MWKIYEFILLTKIVETQRYLDIEFRWKNYSIKIRSLVLLWSYSNNLMYLHNKANTLLSQWYFKISLNSGVISVCLELFKVIYNHARS